MSTKIDQEVAPETEAKNNADRSRRKIRSLIFHLLYAMEEFEYSISLPALIDNFNRGFDLDIKIDDEVATTTHAIINDRDQLDIYFKPYLINWRYERLGVCTKLILRFATWELYSTDTASSIIINEAIELAKCFSEKDAYKFINGVLDEVVKHKESKE